MEAEIAEKSEKSEKSAENENRGKTDTAVEEGSAQAGEMFVEEGGWAEEASVREGARAEKACVNEEGAWAGESLGKEDGDRKAAASAKEENARQAGRSAETNDVELAETARLTETAKIKETAKTTETIEDSHPSDEAEFFFQRARASLQNRDLWLRRIALMLADMLVITAAGLFVLWARFEFHWEMIEPVFLKNFAQHLPFLLVAMLIIFWCFRLYHSLWEFAGMQEVIRVPLACVTLMAADYLLIELFWNGAMPRSYFPLTLLCESWGIIGVRFLYRSVRSAHMRRKKKTDTPVVRKKIMVIGAGQAGAMIVREIQNSSFSKGIVCCVIDDDEQKHGSYIHGIRVVGGRNVILRYAERYQIDQIIIAMPSQSKKTVREILDICKETSCDLKVLPGMYQIVNDEVSIKDLRDVDINDLLGREPVRIDNESVCRYVTDKVILVTGGGGSIGSELCRQISDRHPKQLIILDIYENNAYDIQQELLVRHPDMNLTVLIGSVRNTNRVEDILSTYRPEIIYHAAAHKHVPLMEDSPNEAIKNNVMGTMKLAQAADKWGVKKFVLISTDKAVNPTNIMGASKRLCEMIIQAYNRHSATDFVAVRFGNVLGSNGSVIPLFQKQIASGGPVTVTDPEIIRYFMTIPEAVSLVLQAGTYAKGGEIFVLDMGEPVKILDLAKNLIRLSGLRLGEDIDIIFTGLRPGEKLYEELLMAEEGLQDTPNAMIHIGEPIELDDEQFFQELYELKAAAEDESKDIRRLVAQMVPTYHYKGEEEESVETADSAKTVEAEVQKP